MTWWMEESVVNSNFELLSLEISGVADVVRRPCSVHGRMLFYARLHEILFSTHQPIVHIEEKRFRVVSLEALPETRFYLMQNFFFEESMCCILQSNV